MAFARISGLQSKQAAVKAAPQKPWLLRKCASCNSGARAMGISEPGDKYELEADRVADEVMRTPDSGAPNVSRAEPEESGLSIRRSCCAECAAEARPIAHE